jgi:hypothetical protein
MRPVRVLVTVMPFCCDSLMYLRVRHRLGISLDMILYKIFYLNPNNQGMNSWQDMIHVIFHLMY